MLSGRTPIGRPYRVSGQGEWIMLVRAAIAGGLLLTTGIASGQVPAVRTGHVQLTDFGVPEV